MLAWLGPGPRRPRGRRAARAPRWRRFVPATVGALLAWALMADPLVLVIAVCPVLVVSALRVVPGLVQGIQNGGGLRQLAHALADRWLEASLAVAAGLAYLAAWLWRPAPARRRRLQPAARPLHESTR